MNVVALFVYNDHIEDGKQSDLTKFYLLHFFGAALHYSYTAGQRASAIASTDRARRGQACLYCDPFFFDREHSTDFLRVTGEKIGKMKAKTEGAEKS